MYRFTGLYDWVEHNDRRSLTLFLGFIVVFQLIALPTLLIFLAVLDPAHAPHHDFGAYALRYGSIVTFFGILAFVWAAWSHQRAVKRALPFAAVDPGAAPRLHRIFEPLAIVAGLPGARLAMLDSAALNAFAYGFARRNATVVVTRGLVDALNDDELAAVLAHELTHIRQGDVRFLIAANACIEAIRTLDRVNMDETKRASLKEHKLLRALVDRGVMTQARALALRDFAGGIVLVLLLPFLLIILLTLLFVRRQLLNLADAFRLLILSSREHIADAGAVELTKNPAALLSALRRIDGRGHLPRLAASHAAMLIDADAGFEGPTHPTLEQRIGAVVALTGTMAVLAPAARDTRPGATRDFGRWLPPLTINDAARARARPVSLPRAWLRVVRARGSDVFGAGAGAGRAFLWGLLASVPLTAVVHADRLDCPMFIAGTFDPRSAVVVAELAGPGMPCDAVDGARSRCPGAETTSNERLRALGEQRNLLGLYAKMTLGDRGDAEAK